MHQCFTLVYFCYEIFTVLLLITNIEFRKRFEKAEVEYIAAKMNLHKATDMKDDLTEHLYNLIQLNEDRKVYHMHSSTGVGN